MRARCSAIHQLVDLSAHKGDAVGKAARGPPAVEAEKTETCVSSATTRWAIGATLTWLLGFPVLLSVSILVEPDSSVSAWPPIIGGIVGLLIMCTCLSRGCSWLWKGRWGSCGDFDQVDDPLPTVKMLCCVMSLTGPVVIMVGSVVMMWCYRMYVAAVAFGASSMGLVVVVAAMDVLAVVRCARCLCELCQRNGRSSIGQDVEAIIVSAVNADVGQLFMRIGICMAINLGVTVSIWVTLGSSLWTFGPRYLTVGLMIFLVPMISLCLVLNCLMISSCAGSLRRCIRCCSKPKKEDD